MHPTVLSCIKAQPLIASVEAAIKVERWVLHGHDDIESETDTIALASYYGRTANRDGGGVGIELDSITGTEAPGVERLEICFSFGHEDIESAIRFVCELDSQKWSARHEWCEDSKRDGRNASVPLAKQLHLKIDGDYRPIKNADAAMAMLAQAADYTFEHCDD